MSAFDLCKTCGTYAWLDRHTCPPRWEARVHGEGDESWSAVFALDAEGAAEKFCEQNDSDLDYAIIQNGSGVIEVREPDADEFSTFDIEAESRPEYTAIERVRP